jgi:hypothetical protein
MIKWKRHHDPYKGYRWSGSIDKKIIGRIFVNKMGSYSITFIRGNDWAACFKTESLLETAKRMVESYYIMHKEKT